LNYIWSVAGMSGGERERETLGGAWFREVGGGEFVFIFHVAREIASFLDARSQRKPVWDIYSINRTPENSLRRKVGYLFGTGSLKKNFPTTSSGNIYKEIKTLGFYNLVRGWPQDRSIPPSFRI
jgi:hypothetical protein